MLQPRPSTVRRRVLGAAGLLFGAVPVVAEEPDERATAGCEPIA